MGWSYSSTQKLRQQLIDAGGKRADRQKIQSVVKAWWNAEENVEARRVMLSAKESALHGYYQLMSDTGFDFKNPDNSLPPAFSVFAENNSLVLNHANTNPAAWDGLKRWAFERAKKGESIPHEVASLLLRPEGRPSPRGKPKGQALWRFNTDVQLAAAVGLLRSETQFKSLGSGKRAAGDPDSPIVILNNSTGQPVESIKNAWNKYKDIFGGH